MFTVAQLANWIKAQPANGESPTAVALFSSLRVSGMNTLKDASSSEVAFFFSRNYQADLMQTRAGVIVTGLDFVAPLQAAGLHQWKTSIFLACADPYLAMGKLSAEFSSEASAHSHRRPFPETIIHPTAVVDPSAKIGNGVQIGAYSIIEAGTFIDDQAVIYPQVYIGPNCSIGESSVLFPKVTLYEKTFVGKRCRLHAGVVLGGDGFGYAPVVDAATKLPIDHQKIYHLGRVVLEDDVEIGPNSTIDRGTMGDTRIHSKVKIDNLVQIGHNAEVGEGSILCGTAGMAGSSSLGKFVYVGANAGTANQVHVGDYAKLAAYTGAAKDVEAHAEMGGVPARLLSDYYKILAMQNKSLRQHRKK
jgi:UDP-3-O-[3-hydroxymyristoyl] glucosamine N-acyltransferase